MSSKKIYWLAGERYLAISRKQEIVGERGDFGVKEIPKTASIDEFASNLAMRDLFGPSELVYIYEGTLPEPAAAAKVIDKLLGEDILVIITDKAPKNTKFYKQFKDHLEYFDPLMDGIRLNHKAIRLAPSKMKKICGWQGSISILEHVLEMSDYNFGAAVLEIEKIRAYNSYKKDKDITKEDCKDIVCNSDREDITKLIEAINFRRATEAFEMWYHISETYGTPPPFHLLLENFYLLLHCRMAYDNGNKQPQDIGQAVSKTWKKKSGPVNPGSIAYRYRMYSTVVQKFSFQHFSYCIMKIEDAIRRSMYQSDTTIANKELIFTHLIFDIFGKPKV